jgi:putative phosphoribosyl transferase
MNTRFADRAEAGRALGQALLKLKLRPPILVVALPRGGVPVGAAIARALGVPLGLILVRKIGAPYQPELAVAAVAEGDPPEIVIDEEVQRATGVDAGYVQKEAQRQLQEIARRRHVYLQRRAAPAVTGHTVIVADDGIATGSTMRAALRALRRQQPAALVLAVPVAPADTLFELSSEADRVVCLSQPSPFHAVGLHYVDFHQVDDDEVLAALQQASAQAGPRSVAGPSPPKPEVSLSS